MSLQNFKASKIGTLVGSILTAPDAVAQMEEKSRADRPAVEAVGAELAVRLGDLADDDRKLVGRWVKEILGSRGWVPDRKGRVAAGNLFNRGTIYRHAGAVQRTQRTGGLAKARALMAIMPHKVMTSEELIATRHRAFEAGE